MFLMRTTENISKKIEYLMRRKIARCGQFLFWSEEKSAEKNEASPHDWGRTYKTRVLAVHFENLNASFSEWAIFQKENDYSTLRNNNKGRVKFYGVLRAGTIDSGAKSLFRKNDQGAKTFYYKIWRFKISFFHKSHFWRSKVIYVGSRDSSVSTYIKWFPQPYLQF